MVARPKRARAPEARSSGAFLWRVPWPAARPSSPARPAACFEARAALLEVGQGKRKYKDIIENNKTDRLIDQSCSIAGRPNLLAHQRTAPGAPRWASRPKWLPPHAAPPGPIPLAS